MKKYIYLFLVLVNMFVPTQAQNTDSLWKVYKDKTQADASRIKALQELAMSYVSNKPDTTLVLAEEALQLADKLPGDDAKLCRANALNSIGISYGYKGNYAKAL